MFWTIASLLGFAVAAFLLIVVAYVVFGLIYHRLYSPYFIYRDLFKGIPAAPDHNLLFGHLNEIIKEPPGEPHYRYMAEHSVPEVPFVITRGVMGRVRLNVTGSEAAHALFVRRVYEKPTFARRMLRFIVGDGLLVTEGEMHRSQRKLLDPSFNHGRIADMQDVFAEKARELVTVLTERIREGETRQDMHNVFTKTTLDVIGKVAFNHEFHALTRGEDSNVIGKRYKDLLGIPPSHFSVLQSFIPILQVFRTSSQRRQERVRRELDDEVKRLIHERREELTKAARSGKVDPPKDLLGSLLTVRDANGNPLSDQELSDQTLTFMLAGHETSSVALTWTLYLLDKNRDALRLVRDELNRCLTDDEVPTLDQELPMLDCVIKESMRLYPPASVVTRVTMEDVEICGHKIPRDTNIFVPLWALHRDKRVWGKDSFEFRPDRFQSLTEAQRRSYIPFIAGLRMCIGHRLAFQEIRVILAMLLRKIDFKTAPDADVQATLVVTLKPKYGMPMDLSLISAK